MDRDMDRSRLVERVHANLERDGWPRIQLFLIVAVAGLAAFIVSYALLSAGVRSMAIRYPVASAAGYLAFLLLIGAWLAAKRQGGLDISPLDFLDVPLPADGGAIRHAASVTRTRSGGGGSWFDADVDFGWVLIAIVALFAGAFAVIYVVWIAPALLAEVLVDAAIVSAVSHRLAHIERRDWTATVVRRTWIPAAVLILMLSVGGYALQRAAPDARSIGPAVETILNR
jgi:hypothetical protein